MRKIILRQKPLVFLGPSLSWHEASQLLDADYRPPASFDDWGAEALGDVELVVLIDCIFSESSTVNPSQILSALGRGIIIYGAASAGALRAVELAGFGMIGVGQIFESYRSGIVNAEEELYVIYNSDSLCSYTLPTINVRRALQVGLNERVVSCTTAIRILEAAKALHFTERTWESVLASVKGGVDQEVIAFGEMVNSQGAALDLKRRDTIDCLKLVAKHLSDGGARQL